MCGALLSPDCEQIRFGLCSVIAMLYHLHGQFEVNVDEDSAGAEARPCEGD